MSTGDQKMSDKFSEGWNNLKVIDENGPEHSQRVFIANSEILKGKQADR